MTSLRRPLTPVVGASIVFLASAAVLIIELTAVRLLAPYVGQTLETFSAIIGTILAGIALGTWMGGRFADQNDPRRLIAFELVTGGSLAIITVPIVRAVGPAAENGIVVLVAVTALAILTPAAVLSAVAPAVVKLTLGSLGETGSVVGRYSAFGTAGAIFGSFLTGFGLVAWFSTPTIVIGLGVLLVLIGIGVGIGTRFALGVLPLAALVAGVSAALGSVCDTETRYYCVTVVEDDNRSSGRLLELDGLDHSFVDLDDPTHLEFTSTRMLAAVIDSKTAGAIEAVHVGGGGFTLPRWLEATRPGSRSLVLELDAALLDVARRDLGLVTDVGLDVQSGDARVSLRRVESASADVVIGDAFGGRAVPWHLTTVEWIRDVDRVLRQPDGVYAMNLIDGPRLDFVRAMISTLQEIWPHVVVVTLPERLEIGGNFVLAGSDAPFDAEAISTEAAATGLDVVVLSDEEATDFADGARPLTDDYAPVDQLLSR